MSGTFTGGLGPNVSSTLTQLTTGTSVVGAATGNYGKAQGAPTIHNSAYSAGQGIGGLLTWAGLNSATGFGGLVQSVTVTFASGITPLLDLVVFDANPTGSTVGDQATFSVATADLGKVVGVVHLSDLTQLGTPAFLQGQTAQVPVEAVTGGTVYGVLVMRSAATPGGTSDMIVTVRTVQ